MGRRDLLNVAERKILFGTAEAHDELVRRYTLSRSDLDLIQSRRGDANRLGFALQLALLRDPGFGLQSGENYDALIAFLAGQLAIPANVLASYGKRLQTLSEHNLELMRALGLRAFTDRDVPKMVTAAEEASLATDLGLPIARAVVTAVRADGLVLPAPTRIERAGISGRAKGRRRAFDGLLSYVSQEQLANLDALLAVDEKIGISRLAWLRDSSGAAKAEVIRGLLGRLSLIRSLEINAGAENGIHQDRYAQLAKEGRATPAHLLARYAPRRRHAILVVAMIDLERRLTDAVLDMADRIIGACFTRGGNAKQRQYSATTGDVGRLMRLFRATIDALETAQDGTIDAFDAVDQAVGWTQLLRARPQVEGIARLAEEDPLIRAADRWTTLRKFVPALLEAIEFKAGRGSAEILKAINLLKELSRAGKRDIPADAPMPFRKEWKNLIKAGEKPDRRLWETAVMAHVRNKLRSGDVWVEKSANYRRFDNYLLPTAKVPPVQKDLGLPSSADEWLDGKKRELDWRLQRFTHRLAKGKLDGVEWNSSKLSIAPVRSDEPDAARELAARIEKMMPPVRITELLHEVARETRFTEAFTNLRTHERPDNENALLAAILADGSNLGLTRMAAASQGVTPDQLTWTQSAYIREETYRAALAKIINAHHALPITGVWGQGTTSSSDGQFFRSGKRGAGSGDFNARYGVDPGFSFYTHVSDQHAPYHVKVISAATHEAPYVLDGLLHHASSLAIDTHYVDTGGATDHVFALCNMLGYRFCPRLRDFADRRLAPFGPTSQFTAIKPLFGKRIKVDVIREHWDEVVRLVASLKEGIVQPSVILRKLAAYERQNQLDLALQEIGRIERTLFMLDWLESPALRRRCHAGLNKSEQRHQLTGAICTFKQGRIADRTHEAQQFRASGLNLVIAAIVYWNSTYTADAVAHLRHQGEQISDELLAHTSPLTWQHIAFSGDFLWDRAATASESRRPLNLVKPKLAA
jgi:TnpA family transposase